MKTPISSPSSTLSTVGSSASTMSSFWCLGIALLMSIAMTGMGIYRMNPSMQSFLRTIDSSNLPNIDGLVSTSTSTTTEAQSLESSPESSTSSSTSTTRRDAKEEGVGAAAEGSSTTTTTEKTQSTTDTTTSSSKSSSKKTTFKSTYDPTKPLNVVLFYADDWSFKTLGAMGNTYVQTPQLDQLARERGVLFTHNCVTSSICMQSRASLYTGQYVSTHKTLFSWRNVSMYEPERWNRTLYPLMLQNGYHVGFMGKYHHLEPPPGPTFHFFESSQMTHYPSRGDGTVHITEWNERDAVRFLTERPQDKPFFMTVSYFATHAEDGMAEGYRPQKVTEHLYQDEPVPRPKTFTEEHFKKLPPFFHNDNFGRGRFRGRYDTPELHQTMMKKMYRMATEVDTACGNILKLLETQGVRDQTLVIFTTDNGNFHGEHGLAEKWYPYEESLRVPLIIDDPRMPDIVRGTSNDDFTLNIDLAPTILSAANIPVPDVMQGRDMSALYIPQTKSDKKSKSKKKKGTSSDKIVPSPPWRQDFFYEFYYDIPYYIPHSVALVGKGFKYIYWMDHNYPQYFNLTADPFEEDDLYKSMEANPAIYGDLLSTVKQRLTELQTSVESGLPQ